jgi:hypothetical protein
MRRDGGLLPSADRRRRRQPRGNGPGRLRDDCNNRRSPGRRRAVARTTTATETDEIAPVWYPDCDKDTFAPASATGTPNCTAPAAAPPGCTGGGWTPKAPGPGTTDCFDTDAAVHPMTATENNAAWSSKAIPGATTAVDYDYNCDGTEALRQGTPPQRRAVPFSAGARAAFAGTAGTPVRFPRGASSNYTGCTAQADHGGAKTQVPLAASQDSHPGDLGRGRRPPGPAPKAAVLAAVLGDAGPGNCAWDVAPGSVAPADAAWECCAWGRCT